MFYSATKFNQAIGNWNVNNVTDMHYMFYDATNFNQIIVNWNVSKVTSMIYMFAGATTFNQDLCTWYNKLNSTTTQVGSMVTSSGCPYNANPNFVSKISFCQACINTCNLEVFTFNT
ncbi:MAG: BspA family leucine-rich repeat surface protein, partial [bacterium]